VAAAGTARIIGQSDAAYIGLEIDLQSGHFMEPLNAAQQAAAEVIGRNAFAMFEINAQMSGKGLPTRSTGR
jgi:hypothetical protein